MTNLERIKNYSAKEMAKFISEITLVCEYCAGRNCRPEECSLGDCVDGVATWLESEENE